MRLVSQAVAVSGFDSLGLHALSWPSWCCFMTGASMWALPLRTSFFVNYKDGSVGGCSAGVFPGFVVVDGGTVVVSVDPNGVVGGLKDGGY